MKQEELWTQEDKAKVVQEDITSLSHPKASDSDILDLISRGHITKDYEELKQFLFHLSIGSMTFPTDGKAWKDPLRYRINEIIIFYDNACGNVSFSVHFSDMKEETHMLGTLATYSKISIVFLGIRKCCCMCVSNQYSDRP